MSYTVAEILEVEKWAELAFCDVLRDAVPPLSVGDEIGASAVFRSRQNRIVETPNIEIKVIAGAIADDHQYIFQNPKYQAYDTYLGELQVSVTTNRTTDSQTPTHTSILGQVRARLNATVLKNNTFNSPVLAFIDCRETGTVDSFESDDTLDISIISWFLMFQIRNDVWPANP